MTDEEDWQDFVQKQWRQFETACDRREADVLEKAHALLDLSDSVERSKWLYDAADFFLHPDLAWKLIAQEWCGCDSLDHIRFEALFGRIRSAWSPGIMLDDDRAFYDSLPERFTIYRGQEADAGLGLSWTVLPERAEFFAKGYRGAPTNKQPAIFTARISKRDVAFATNERQEGEIVLFNRQDLSDLERLQTNS